YYDIVFGRDVSREIDFVNGVYRQCVGHDPTSLLDLACGPGYHARNFARRGHRAVGLDLREEMIAFAQEQADEDGVTVEWIAEDMRHLLLENPVDVAINMFDGIDCLQTNDDLLAHFRAIAASLTPGGLYIIDATHPRDVSYCYHQDYRYKGERDGVKVEIVWAVNHPTMDPVSHVLHTDIEMHIDENGQHIMIPDSAQERVLTAQEIIMLAKLSGVFEPVSWYGDFDLNQPFDMSPKSRRMITVLQKVV
ncbi:MAG TPA: class I SAM-dependent methyltransferase, partial [Phototrophicaceae bacterium]|nr:class I SAM-dependent methyltransferase [Phototrophicaceae bacterium]